MFRCIPFNFVCVERLMRFVPRSVSMRACEVYCNIYGPQEALVTGDCRGGFSVGELGEFPLCALIS